MKRRLTPKTIDALPPATGKRYEARDTIIPGLHLRVSATGWKVWYLSARVDRRNRRIKLGSYPALSLSDARERARDVLRDINIGTFEKGDAGSPGAPVPTLGEVIPQFIELHAKPRNRDWKGTKSILTRAQTQSYPECDEGGECDGGEEVSGELVIARGDAPEVLEAAEGILDQMAVAVSLFVIGNGPLPVAASRNDRDDRDTAEHLAQRVGIIALVGQDIAGTLEACQQDRRGLHVGDIASGQVKGEGPTHNVSQSMDFAGLPAA